MKRERMGTVPGLGGGRPCGGRPCATLSCACSSPLVHSGFISRRPPSSTKQCLLKHHVSRSYEGVREGAVSSSEKWGWDCLLIRFLGMLKETRCGNNLVKALACNKHNKILRHSCVLKWIHIWKSNKPYSIFSFVTRWLYDFTYEQLLII